MGAARNINTLVGATTRYIAGRNAMQTVYWRTSPGSSGKMLKYNRTCEFDRSQKVPANVRCQNQNRNYRALKD